MAPLATDQSSLLREIMMAHSGQPCSGELWVPYPAEAWLFPPAQKQQTCHGHSEVALVQPKGGRPSTDGQSICSSLLCLWVPPPRIGTKPPKEIKKKKKKKHKGIV